MTQQQTRLKVAVTRQGLTNCLLMIQLNTVNALDCQAQVCMWLCHS